MLCQAAKNDLADICPVLFDEPMCRRTTFRIGGPAECLAMPENPEQVMELLKYCRRAGIPVTVLGNCSNVLVRDGGVEGVTLLINANMSSVSVQGETLTAQAGIAMSSLAQLCIRASLTGFEFASGIPGCLGGGIYMNAGAYNGEIGSLVSRVFIIDEELEYRTLSHEEMCFGYRRTALSGRSVAVLGAELKLERGRSEDISAAIADFTRRRRERQPLNYPSAGSVFKRPEGAYAAALIDGAGLKGTSVGGAEVSQKHAGFFVNTGGATASDVLALIDKVRQTVMDKTGFILEPEIKIIGHD